MLCSLLPSWGRGGVLPYMSYIGISAPKCDFSTILVINSHFGNKTGYVFNTLVLNWVCCFLGSYFFIICDTINKLQALQNVCLGQLCQLKKS